jgi:hypothetical protein
MGAGEVLLVKRCWTLYLSRCQDSEQDGSYNPILRDLGSYLSIDLKAGTMRVYIGHRQAPR